MIAPARNKRKEVKLEQNFASAFTDTARLLSVDQPIFAVGAELHALGAVAVIGYDFSRTIALLTKHTYHNSAGATTVTTGHQRASTLLYWEGLHITAAGYVVENLLRLSDLLWLPGRCRLNVKECAHRGPSVLAYSP